MAGNFIQKATARMKKKGTVGSFGKATPGKIKAGLAKGGAMAKKAAFAKAMETIASRRKGRGSKRTAARKSSRSSSR